MNTHILFDKNLLIRYYKHLLVNTNTEQYEIDKDIVSNGYLKLRSNTFEYNNIHYQFRLEREFIIYKNFYKIKVVIKDGDDYFNQVGTLEYSLKDEQTKKHIDYLMDTIFNEYKIKNMEKFIPTIYLRKEKILNIKDNINGKS